MSSHGNDFAAILCQFLLSYDGAVLGVTLACSAIRTLLKFHSTSHALRKLETAPQVRVCDLRALLEDDGKKSQTFDHEKNSSRLVVVRGHVEAKSAVEGKNWKNWTNGSGVLVSNYSGHKAVIIQRTQTWLYNEWRGFFGLTPDIHTIFGRSWRKKESSLRMVGVLDEEKILPLGENISAVGICSLKNGIPEICSCKDLPYFLNWNRWKECRELRRLQRTTQAHRDNSNSQDGGDDEAIGDIPDGQLCVICLVRRRMAVFGPCGHVVCCHRCAISVEREISPKCPICRMPIQSSMRIFFS